MALAVLRRGWNTRSLLHDTAGRWMRGGGPGGRSVLPICLVGPRKADKMESKQRQKVGETKNVCAIAIDTRSCFSFSSSDIEIDFPPSPPLPLGTSWCGCADTLYGRSALSRSNMYDHAFGVEAPPPSTISLGARCLESGSNILRYSNPSQ